MKRSLDFSKGERNPYAAGLKRSVTIRLDRFTIDRLMRILDRLNRDVRVKISVAPRGRSSGRHLPSPLAA